jgi:hypothetical protein
MFVIHIRLLFEALNIQVVVEPLSDQDHVHSECRGNNTSGDVISNVIICFSGSSQSMV